MSVSITTRAIEEGTCVITCAFSDEDGNAVAPNTLMWTLTDMLGNVINSREQVSVSSPSSSEDIVLSGDDLALQSTEVWTEVKRLLTLEGTYDSSYGSSLPFKEQIEFYVSNLRYIT